MNTETIALITDARRINGLIATLASVGPVTAVVVGTRPLAEVTAHAACERVAFFETAPDVPPEAYAAAVSTYVAQRQPCIVMSNDDAHARMLCAATAQERDAAILANVIALSGSAEGLIATCQLAGGIAVEDYAIEGPLVAVFSGQDADPAGTEAPIEAMTATPADVRIVGTIEPESSSVNLADATRIVGIGRGVKQRADLTLVESLATKLGAEVACTLPVCDDLHWYGPERVLGSSHHQAGPELYLALGIQGAPNHVAGVRDAKTVVGVNTDPGADIFRACKYGIVGDLYEIVPELEKQL